MFDCVWAVAGAMRLSQTLPARAVAAAAEVLPRLAELRARALAQAAAPSTPPPAWASPQSPPPPPRPPATPSTGGSAAGHAASAAHAAFSDGDACAEAGCGALGLLAERLLGPLSETHCLLLLDNLGDALRADAQLGALCSALLRCRRVRLLCTSAAPLGLALAGVPEKVVHLTPLDAHTAARLVVRAAPRPLLRSELDRTLRRVGGSLSTLQCLAQHELVTAVIRGLPGRLFELVPRLHARTLDELAREELGEGAGEAVGEGAAREGGMREGGAG